MKLILWFMNTFLNHFPLYIYISPSTSPPTNQRLRLHFTRHVAVGRAYSMNRLDQLAQPIRRNGEHVRSILERERRERELEMLDETSSLASGSTRRGYAGRGRRAGSASANTSGTSTAVGAMSRSMTHLAGGTAGQQRGGGGGKYSLGGGISSNFRPLGSVGQRDSSKSMTQISYTWSQFGTPHTTKSTTTNNSNHNNNNTKLQQQQQEQRQSNLGLQTSATKKYLESSFASSQFSASFSTLSANATRRAQQQYATATNPQFYRYLDLDPNSLLLMNSSSLLVNAGVCDQKTTTTKPPQHLTKHRTNSQLVQHTYIT